MAENGTCKQHTGLDARICHVERENGDQWEKIGKMDNRIDKIFSRLNIILGGVVVACIMLVLNFLVKA